MQENHGVQDDFFSRVGYSGSTTEKMPFIQEQKHHIVENISSYIHDFLKRFRVQLRARVSVDLNQIKIKYVVFP